MTYSINANDFVPKIFGISQDSNTNNYILIQDVYCSGNKKIDNFIQEMQLKRNSYNDIIFEWIPYNQFNNIKEISKGDSATVYSAIWKDGPLYYKKEYMRKSDKEDKEVILNCLPNSQNIVDDLLNKAIQNLLI